MTFDKQSNARRIGSRSVVVTNAERCFQESTSSYVQSASSSSSSSVVAPVKMDMINGHQSSPSPVVTGSGGGSGGRGGGGTTDFESFCDERQREEARFSPPRLGQTHGPAAGTVTVAVASSSSPVAIADGAGGVFSLFNVSGAENTDFASE